MKANDFRIGNYTNKGIVQQIAYFQGIMHIWTIKDQFQSFGEAFRIDQIDPIPFTEQWLIDFGYEDGLKGYHENNFSGLIKVEWSGTIKSWELSIGSMSIVLFNYVHEFQNIIFFLTGEELKLNKQ